MVPFFMRGVEGCRWGYSFGKHRRYPRIYPQMFRLPKGEPGACRRKKARKPLIALGLPGFVGFLRTLNWWLHRDLNLGHQHYES